MQVIHHLDDWPQGVVTAATFGNFDGVHLGHRALIDQTRREAQRLGASSLVVTFDPHPLAVLRPDRAPRAIDDLLGRISHLGAHGLDLVLVLTFDAQLAARSADWFASELLWNRLGVRSLTVGPDTRFGHGGHGDLALLRRTGDAVGAAVTALPPVLFQGEAVSSSRVRRAIEQGDVALAAQLLGRPFALRGAVVQGDQRGRVLGFPTVNLSTSKQIQPAAGVYAGQVQLPDGRMQPAVTNCGMRPTFSGLQWRVESHLLDFSEDLYGQWVAVELTEHLRPEQRFEGPEALRAQIVRDIGSARRALGLA